MSNDAGFIRDQQDFYALLQCSHPCVHIFNVYLKEFTEKLPTQLTVAEPDKWPHALCKLVTLSDTLKQLTELIAASDHLKQAFKSLHTKYMFITN